MPSYKRFIYAATSTASPSTIRQHLIEITKICEELNTIDEISGILVYGNNSFLHWIEGSEKHIKKVHQMSLNSHYSKDFLLLKNEKISKKSFKFWSVAYFVREKRLQEFFTTYQLPEFNPYLLKDDLLEKFMQIILDQQHLEAENFSSKVEPVARMRESNRLWANYFSFNYFFGGLLIILLVTLVFFIIAYLQQHPNTFLTH